MLRIKFFSDFCTSKNCAQVYIRILKHLEIPEYGKQIIFTDLEEGREDDYTHAVLLNTPMPSLKCPKENVLGLAFEPPQFLNITKEFIEYAIKHIGKYYIGNTAGLPTPPFVEHPGFMWHIPFLEEIKTNKKENKISIIFSEKRFAPGHNYRFELVKEILLRGLPIDIYGRGIRLLASNLQFRKYLNDNRVKGEFEDYEPYVGYDFSIAIENFQHPAYISEKFMNPILCGTTPIYLGAKNVDHYYPGTCIELSGILDKDILLLNDVIQNSEKYKKNIDTKDCLKRSTLLLHLLNFILTA